ncbi:hypothetical protein DFQ28_006544 [Apophysomyces sp. BC1034]|nr:hypothetical protein DFQ30_008270 [Apophysomyces sp. BC1015]KAG0176492.1 hypothetical protein DFQ29_006063 [Apophysomyces sp. BC1021]KAG0187290.1 hypothetical protein DFQ28_006544 [Apophysomyces sp. BC1034]
MPTKSSWQSPKTETSDADKLQHHAHYSSEKGDSIASSSSILSKPSSRDDMPSSDQHHFIIPPQSEDGASAKVSSRLTKSQCGNQPTEILSSSISTSSTVKYTTDIESRLPEQQLACKDADPVKVGFNDKKENWNEKRKKKKQNKIKASQPSLPAKNITLPSKPGIEPVERVNTKKRAGREVHKAARKLNKVQTPTQQDMAVPEENKTTAALKPVVSEPRFRKKEQNTAKSLVVSAQGMSTEKQKAIDWSHNTGNSPQNWYSPFSTGLEIDIVPRSPPSPGMASRGKRHSSGHGDYRLFSDTPSPVLPAAPKLYSYEPIFFRNNQSLRDDYGLGFPKNAWPPPRSPPLNQPMSLHVPPPSPPNVPYSLHPHFPPPHEQQQASVVGNSIEMSPPLLSRVVGRSPFQQDSGLHLPKYLRDCVSLPDLSIAGLSSSQHSRQQLIGEQTYRDPPPQQQHQQTYASAASSSSSFPSETKYFSLFARHNHH